MTDGDPGAFAEIQMITAELASLDVDDLDRTRLLRRRDELRAQARIGHLTSRDPGLLHNELAHLRARLADLDGEKIQTPRWQQRLGGRMNDPEAAHGRINRRIEEANAGEIASIERRIVDIEEALRWLDDDPSAAPLDP